MNWGPKQVVNLDKSKLNGSSGFEPLEYVKKHRLEIIEELLGLIENTNFKENENLTSSTRFYKWEKILRNVMSTNGFIHFLDNASEMSEVLDQDLLSILETVIIDSRFYFTPVTAQSIFEKVKELNRFNQISSLSPAKIGRILTSKSSIPFIFIGSDGLSYRCEIIKKSNSLKGGHNSSYIINASLDNPVSTVTLIQESKCNVENIQDEIAKDPTLPEETYAHEVTDYLLERGIAISPELVYGKLSK